jgi:hypothetical protein
MAEEKALNIYQRMSAATSEISRVAKNLNVGFGKSSYKAVGEADVLAAVKPIEEKYGIYSYPVSREIIESGILESVSEYNGEKTTKKQFQMRVSTVYRFVNVDKPEEYIDITTYGDGVDSQDKAPGKAMTYADKYALLKAYKIMTGDDPDQNASGETKGYSRKVDAPKAPELISEKDKEILRKTVADKGYELDQIFPKGIDGLTAEQYAKAMAQLKGMKPKNG